MKLVETIKSQPFFERLMREKDTLKSAVMFFCNDSLTSKVALIMTALLLEYPTFEMFDENSAEFLRISKGADIDVKVYPKGERLLVSDSNEIVSEAYVKPVNLQKKIFLISNFDNATEEAQNKLLKVLEEPPKNVCFLLSATSREKVLPTIISRCTCISIDPLNEKQMKNIVPDELSVVLGEGYIGKTVELSKRDDLKNLASFAISLLCEMKSSKQVLKFSKALFEQKENLDIILQVLSLGLEDILKLKCDEEKLCRLKMFQDEMKDVEPEYSVQAVCEINYLISRLKEKLEFNANLSITLDNFLLKILEVKYLCK